MTSIISTFPADATTIALIVLLISAFVIAFKIMKMVLEAVTVAAVSGIFYLVMAFSVLEGGPSLNSFLLYAFLGSGLYMVFSFMSSAYSLASALLEIPYRLLMYGLKPFGWIYRKAMEKKKLDNLRKKLENEREKFERRKKNKGGGKGEDGNDTKEVVLDKVNPEKKD